MSQASIRKAIEKRLALITPAIVTAFENADFKPPEDDVTPYQRVFLVPARPNNPTTGGTFVQENGFYQVTLKYPLGAGSADAQARAKAVRDWFPRGTQLTEDGITTTISNTPQELGGVVEGDRWSVAVRIPYFANIS